MLGAVGDGSTAGPPEACIGAVSARCGCPASMTGPQSGGMLALGVSRQDRPERGPGFRRLRSWRPGGYLRASGRLLGWMMLRAAGQAVLVISLARLLGADSFGRFATALAITAFFVPLAGLGLSGVMLRDLARAPQRLPEDLSQALRLWWRGAVVFGFLGLVTALAVLHGQFSVSVLLVFVPAEIASGSLVELLARVEQSQHRTGRYGAIVASLVLVRLAFLGVFAALDERTVVAWMLAYASAGIAYAIVLFIRALRIYHPGGRQALRYGLVRDGLAIAWGGFSLRVQAEFNKPVLAQLGFALAGRFSVSQRAMDVASLPLAAMQDVLWPRLYASTSHSRRMLVSAVAMVCLAVAGGVALFMMAPLLPHLLGRGFSSTANVLRWLAWLPALQVVRNVGTFHIMATHRVPVLVWSYAAGTVTSVTATAILALKYGLAGAALAAYLTECATIVTQLALLSGPLRGRVS